MGDIEDIAAEQGWTTETLLTLILKNLSSKEYERLVGILENIAQEENDYENT